MMRLIGFPLIYLGWAYALWSPIPGSGESVWAFPNVLFFLAGGASPLLAGLVMAYATEGCAGVVDLGRRLVAARRVPAGWWLVILGFWPLFDLGMAGVALLAGIVDQPVNVAWRLFGDPGLLGLLLVLSFVFPAVEEVGLRGYYLDALQARFSPAVAGLLNGVTWAAWHTPFVWFPGYYANTTFNPALWWWLPSIVLQTLLIVRVYNATGRSILAVLVFHAMMNLTGEVLGLAPALFPFMLWGYAVLAGLLLVHWSRHDDRAGWRGE